MKSGDSTVLPNDDHDPDLAGRFERVVELLTTQGVEFIVIGGMAEVLHGGLRPTYDIDLCYRRSSENYQRLANTLAELHPKLRGAPEGIPFIFDARAISMGSNFTFETDLGDLDLLGWVEPIGEYAELMKQSVVFDLPCGKINAIALDALIQIKEHLGRPKDKAALPELYAIRDERSQSD